MIKNCNSEKELEQTAQHNIEALTDSVKTWKTIAGNAVSEKKILIGDIKMLMNVNDSLYNIIKEMELNRPEAVVQIKTQIIREKADTVWQIDTIKNNFIRTFDFSDKWRTLYGNVQVADTTMKLSIDKDIVNANYTLAVEKGKAFVHTENPYIQVNEINGIELPKEKQKKFHIGPQVGVGFGVDVNRKIFVTQSVGIGVTWSLISF